MCLSVLLLGWDRAHAEMRVMDLGQCYRDLDKKAKRWSNCRTLHKRRTRKKKKKVPAIESRRCQKCLPPLGFLVKKIKVLCEKVKFQADVFRGSGD